MAAESSPIYVISTQISRVNIPLAGKAGLISKMADEDPGKFEVQSGWFCAGKKCNVFVTGKRHRIVYVSFV